MITILNIIDLAPPFGLVPVKVAPPPLVFVPNFGETAYPAPDWTAEVRYPEPDWSDDIRYPER